MAESSIVVFADRNEQRFYRGLDLPGEKLAMFGCSEAFEKMNRLRPEIVLVDCGTRVKSGLKLLKHIKETAPRTLVVLLTDVSSELAAVTAFRWGAREYIKKPVSPKLLRVVVRELLALKRNSREKRSPPGADLDGPAALASDLKNRTIPDRLMEVLLHIEENLSNKMTLASLAAFAKLDRFYFTRYFKAYVGTSPMKHVNAKRVRLAQHLLGRTDLNITEISLLVGFGDLNTLNAHFKKSTGLTPSAFKKKIKAGRFPRKTIGSIA